MNFALNILSNLFYFLFLISAVYPWTTLEVYYKICEQNKTSIIHYDEINNGSYGGYIGYSSGFYNVKQTSYDDGTRNFSAVIYGCNDACTISLIFTPDYNNQKEHLPTIDNFTYSCNDSGYRFNPNMTYRVTYYHPTFPNQTDPAAPSVTYDYCTKGLNIENGSKLSTSHTDFSSCIDELAKYGDPNHPFPPFKNVLNVAGSDYHNYMSGANFEPSTLRLVTASINVLTSLNLQLQGINLAFQDLSTISGDMVTDLTPPARQVEPVSTTLLNTLRVIGFIVGAIPGDYVPALLSAAIFMVVSNIAAGGQDKLVAIKDFGFLINDLHNYNLNSVQAVADFNFKETIGSDNYTLFDSNVFFDSDNNPYIKIADTYFKPLKADLASKILNFYDVVVCKNDDLDRVCNEHVCCELRTPFVCDKYWFCNSKRVADNCLLMGGYGNGGGGIYQNYNSYTDDLSKYGDLSDACAIRNNQRLNGWNLTLADCYGYVNCCYCDGDTAICELNNHIGDQFEYVPHCFANY